MVTQWQQVEDWINSNRIERWIFTASNRNNQKQEGGTPNDKIVDSDYLPEDRNEKLAITKQMLEQYGMRAYGYGWQGKRQTDGLYIEVQLNAGGFSMPMPGVGNMPAAPSIDRAQLEREITEKVKNQIKLEQYEEERKAFEQEKKEFQKEKEGVMGMVIGYLRPVMGALAGKHVAGVDAPSEVVVDPVAPLTNTPAPEVEQPTERDFTPEEEDKVYSLMVRFKKCEPRYIELIESVVSMCEAGDQTYTMAKSFLLKD